MKMTSLALSSLLILTLSVFSSGQELLVRYSFDERDGAAIDTGTGDVSNGALGATAVRTDNTPGMVSPFAIDLRAEGTDSFISAGDALEVDTLTSFTLTTWLLLEGLNVDQDGSGNVRLLAKQAGDPFNGFSWNLNNPNSGLRGTDSFRTGLFVGGEDGFSFAFAAEDAYADEWAFLAVTYDGTLNAENVGFYFGDTQTETFLLTDAMESISAGPLNSTAGEADFGIGFTDAAPGIDFSAFGFQDDVRVYDGVLSVEQLEAVRLENLTPNVCDATTGGDIDGDGQVAFADFLVLSANFGMAVDSHAAGDLDCDGTVAFADFLVLSANFGQPAQTLATVPEPTGLSIAGGLLVVLLMGLRHSRRADHSTSTN